MLVLALAVDDLLQPEPRLNWILRQAKFAFEERFAEITRGEVRAEMCSVGREKDKTLIHTRLD